jgi:hypothetical protein
VTLTTDDAPLLQHTDPAMARPLPEGIREARNELEAIVGDILAIPESALEREWPWLGGGEADVRYGIYRVHELIERAEVEAARAMQAGGRGDVAVALIAPSTAARWDLHGLLVPLTDADLDADPGGGEWSIRLAMGHTINGQRAYGWSTAWWQQRGFAIDDPDLPPHVPDEIWADLPDEATAESAGTVDELRRRLDATLDLSAERLAAVPDDRLGFGARWSGFAVPISFRLSRWSSHIREHTIQIEKTLATIGRWPTEPERLLRLTLAGYGRAEATVFGRSGPDAAADIIRAAVAEAREIIADARRTAEA